MNAIRPSSVPAIEHAGQVINYAQFCAAAHRLVASLQELDPARDVPVAIMMERGFGLYASQFAVLANGAFFLPIDPANPDDRIKFLLADSGARCVIADAAAAKRIEAWGVKLPVVEVSNQEIVAQQVVSEDLAPLVFPHGGQDPAYMIYTSGSTGKPKGVVIHWEAICNHNDWFISEYEIRPADRCLQIASIGFDISLEEIFTTLRAGACLVTIDAGALDSPIEFFRWVAGKQLTVLNVPTALWHNLVPALETESLSPTVRLVLIGGEQVNADRVAKWFSQVPASQVRLVNAYGPTETTITATVCDLSTDCLNAIGLPISNLECHVVNQNQQLVCGLGEPGELYISGVGVAQGYWNRPEQTAKAFVNSPVLDGKWCYRTGDKVQWDADGQLQFLGRVDNQVKLRGFRIELHEIEDAILKHPEVTDVVVRKTETGREQLVCFATVDSHQQISSSSIDQERLRQDLVEFLKTSLPHYMVPSQFSFLDEFPQTVGGKVDVKKMMATIGADQPSPTNMGDCGQLEVQIADIWQQVLGEPPASVDTTFERSGGDSLAAMAMALGLEKAFAHKTFGVATLLQYPTTKKLAEYVASEDTSGRSEVADPLAPIINTLGQPLDAQTPCLVFLHPGGGSGYLYHQLLDESITSTHSVLFVDSPWLTGDLPQDVTSETVVSIARRYAQVLAQQLPVGSEIITCGYSLGGILAFEVARFLVGHGFQVNRVLNIDQPIPAAIKPSSLPVRLLNWMHRLKTPMLTWHELTYTKKKLALEAGDQSVFANPQEMLRSFKLENLHAKIEDGYQPQFCGVQLHVIRGDVIEAKQNIDSDYGWTDYCDQLHLHRIQGTHFTLFMGRNLAKLAKKFQQGVR